MTNFTQSTLGTKCIFLFSLFVFISFFSHAQFANEIFTDYGGFWKSTQTAFNPIVPVRDHNVIGFTYNGITYSTNANDAILTNNNVAYTPGKYRTLPFTSIAGSVPTKNNSIYIATGELNDGVASGYSSPLPSIKVKDALTDGLNGLNIGTGVTDLPSAANMVFPASIISNSAIDDNQPDIIYAQINDAATSADVMLFQDENGQTVGKSNPIQWNLVKSVGSQYLDLYNLTLGATLDNAAITSGNTSKSLEKLRLATFRLSDFGITVANASQVKFFVIKPAGSSDPAFIAYNTEAIYINPPTINTEPTNQVACTGTGQSATFSVSASGYQLTYQWMKDGVNIPEATNTSYTIPAVTAANEGGYQVAVTNAGGTVYSTVAYLNTTINRQPSPATQEIVTGNTVTYSISARGATSFQWKKNGVDIPGAIDSVYTMNPLTRADSGTYTVTVINAAGNGCANKVSNPVYIKPIIVVYSKSTPDINIPSTWGANTDGSGSTPVDFTRSEHTFVLSNRPYGNTLTDLTIAGTLDVKDGEAIIAENTTLDVGWCIRTGTGSITGSTTSGLTVHGDSYLYFTPSSQVLKNFSIKGGTTNMLSDLTISGGEVDPGKLNLIAGTLSVANNKITLRSTSITNTSMFTAVGSSASVSYGLSGAFIVERFIPAKRSYRFISPAVTTTTSIKTNWMEGAVNPDRWTNLNPIPGYGTHISGPISSADSLDVTQTYNPSLFIFDQNSQGWKPVPNSAGSLTAGNAFRFMIRGSRSVDLNDNLAQPSNTIIRTTGQLTLGTHTIGSPVLSTKVGGYSFVGNPYACPIDWRLVSRSGVSSSYYTWDEKLNTRGAYVAYNGLSETNSSIASLVDENIQSSQAFFVQSTSTTPSLTFRESHKSYTNTDVFRSSALLSKFSVQLLLNLNGRVADVADGFVAVFGENFSKTIGEEDAYKFTNLDENIAINRNGSSLSIEGRPLITENDTLPIRVWQFRQKNYWLKIDPKNFETTYRVKLIDQYLKKESVVSLSSSNTIPFSINTDSASFANNRFYIVFEPARSLPVALTNVTAYNKDKTIQVEWKTENETNIQKYEVEKSLDGRQFKKTFTIEAKNDNGVVQGYNWPDDQVANGNNFYRIKIIENTGHIKYSAIVRVNIAAEKSGLTIYPNPVTGKVISLQMANMEKGNYTVTIYNKAGQKVYSNPLFYAGGTDTRNITLKQKLPKGSYSLQLGNNKATMAHTILVQ